MKTVPGLKFVASVPPPSKIVSILAHDGIVYVATETEVWKLSKGKLRRVNLKREAL